MTPKMVERIGVEPMSEPFQGSAIPPQLPLRLLQWSGERESNPHILHGKQVFYH